MSPANASIARPPPKELASAIASSVPYAYAYAYARPPEEGKETA
jgi:hypothetical protein